MEYGMGDWLFLGGGEDKLLMLYNLSSFLNGLFEVLIWKLSRLIAFSLTIAFFGPLYYPFAGFPMSGQGKGEEDGLVS